MSNFQIIHLIYYFKTMKFFDCHNSNKYFDVKEKILFVYLFILEQNNNKLFLLRKKSFSNDLFEYYHIL
jgi:hypothetical protein